MSLPAPAPDQAYMHVSALQAGMISLPEDLVLANHPRVRHNCPSLAFYLEHSATGENLVFDLGLRKDVETYPPAARAYFEGADALMPVEVPQDVAESLSLGGVHPESVQRVVLSHLHFDHIGDHTPFTRATFLLGADSEANLSSSYPISPTSTVLADSVPLPRTVFLNRSEHFTTPIGPFPLAYDLFGDGSAYIIDTPGHCGGHLTLLVRTSPDSWLFLGGDIAHDARLLTDWSTDISEKTEGGEAYCSHHDPVRARADIQRARELVRKPGVRFIIAHDWEWFQQNVGEGKGNTGASPMRKLNSPIGAALGDIHDEDDGAVVDKPCNTVVARDNLPSPLTKNILVGVWSSPLYLLLTSGAQGSAL
ncbi:Lactamase-B domain-containing protein [Mycena kentingensis (nom. inval.)]|nr:Lactamase-B domain-containing protein [Mycena kentingensis (nom. inval.)]